jgi:large subunit ribosomal protein L23
MALLDRFRKKPTFGKAAEDGQPVKKSAPKDAKVSAKPKKSAEKKQAPAGETIVGKTSGGQEHADRMLLKPHVSEKAARLADRGIYVFDVTLGAEKIAIKKAVEALYGVQVKKVRMIRGIGKPVRRGRKLSRRSSWKKALVEVKSGQTIDLYEGV